MVCFDMDGTVNIGNQLIPGAKECFDFLIENNISYVFITNNSSKNVTDYVKKMNRLGIPCTEYNFFTSIEASKIYVKEHGYQHICLVGTKSFENEMQDYDLVREYEKGKADCVLFGYDTELTYKKLEVATKYLEDGVPFIATNPDLRCPMEEGRYLPDCGSFCHMMEDTTGRKPIYLGKPNAAMIELLLKKYNLQKEDILVVGDRLYTDIKVAVNARVDSVGVLSGECTQKDFDESPFHPTYLIDSIASLPEILSK